MENESIVVSARIPLELDQKIQLIAEARDWRKSHTIRRLLEKGIADILRPRTTTYQVTEDALTTN